MIEVLITDGNEDARRDEKEDVNDVNKMTEEVAIMIVFL